MTFFKIFLLLILSLTLNSWASYYSLKHYRANIMPNYHPSCTFRHFEHAFLGCTIAWTHSTNGQIEYKEEFTTIDEFLVLTIVVINYIEKQFQHNFFFYLNKGCKNMNDHMIHLVIVKRASLVHRSICGHLVNKS